MEKKTHGTLRLKFKELVGIPPFRLRQFTGQHKQKLTSITWLVAQAYKTGFSTEDTYKQWQETRQSCSSIVGNLVFFFFTKIPAFSSGNNKPVNHNMNSSDIHSVSFSKNTYTVCSQCILFFLTLLLSKMTQNTNAHTQYNYGSSLKHATIYIIF